MPKGPIIVAGIICFFALGGPVATNISNAADKALSRAEQGKKLTKEMCQACHQFKGADQAGSVGPPFVSMQQRFSDRKKLHAIIFDARATGKPHTMMPPFGRNALLDNKQIDLIIDFIYTL